MRVLFISHHASNRLPPLANPDLKINRNMIPTHALFFTGNVGL
jgi:hypothetical protein